MTLKEQLDALMRDRNNDTEWLCKYKRIIDGLQQIAEIYFDTIDNDTEAWASIYNGLCVLSDIMKEDLDGRKEKDDEDDEEAAQ